MTACSGRGGSSPALPNSAAPANHARVVRDISPNDLHAGGTSSLGFAFAGDNQPMGSAVNTQQPGPLPGSILNGFNTASSAYYCQTGDAFAKQSYIGAAPTAAAAACANYGDTPTGFGARQDPLDFVAVTQGITTAEYATYKADREPATGTNYGEPFEAPVSADAIAFGYRPGDFAGLTAGKRLKLSRWTYCAIANGTIADWNDPAITADNGGSVTAGASLPLTFIYRTDADGINLNLQRHLTAVCPEGDEWHAPYNAAPYENLSAHRDAQWTGGAPSATWTGPTTGHFQGVALDIFVLITVQAQAGAIGYEQAEEIPNAGFPRIDGALVQNSADYHSSHPGTTFVDPLAQPAVQASLALVNSLGTYAIRYGGAGDAGFGTDQPSQLGTSRPECVLYVKPITYVNPQNAAAYPIVELQYLLFLGQNNVHGATDQKLVSYLTATGGGADTTFTTTGYATMPTAIKAAVTSAATGTNPCLK
jgi:ABC-type phosphate transport system substrate-binding protein